jgi:hypothetical protein
MAARFALSLVAATACLTACGGGGGSGLVGRWKHQIRYTQLFSEEWSFQADGGFTYDSYFTGREHIAGTYQINGRTMRISGQSDQYRTTIEREWTFYQAGDRLVIAAAFPEGAGPLQGAAGTFVSRFGESWPDRGFRTEWTSRYDLGADGAATVTRAQDGQVRSTAKGTYLRFGPEQIQLELSSEEAPDKVTTLHLLVDGAVLAEEPTIFDRQ